MMGRQAGDQRQLFCAFDLETIAPADHMLRGIDAMLDLSDLRAHLRVDEYWSDRYIADDIHVAWKMLQEGQGVVFGNGKPNWCL